MRQQETITLPGRRCGKTAAVLDMVRRISAQGLKIIDVGPRGVLWAWPGIEAGLDWRDVEAVAAAPEPETRTWPRQDDPGDAMEDDELEDQAPAAGSIEEVGDELARLAVEGA